MALDQGDNANKIQPNEDWLDLNYTPNHNKVRTVRIIRWMYSSESTVSHDTREPLPR